MNHLKIGGIAIVSILLVSVFISLFFVDRSSGEAVKMLPAYDTRCIDSDKGLNFTEKGTTKGMYQSKFAVKVDSCINSSHLMEYYCSRNKVQSAIKDCGEMGNYGCEGGVCMKKGKLSNAIDTLIIVNTDEYNLTKSDIEKVFQKAEEYWLFPKTQTKFNLLGIEYYSLSQKDWKEWAADYFLEGNKIFPEYIVVFKKDINGGYGSVFELEYILEFYGYEKEINYCNEFKPYLEDYNGQVVPAAIVDYGHKYAPCGYDEKNEKVISGISINGQCSNQEGLLCVWKNGYQMCPNKVDNFYAQDIIIFTANTIIHELLHSYANDSIEYEHFSTVCAYNKLGWDQQNSFDYYLETLDTIEPFDDIVQEYAVICPYVWQQFNNSKQICIE